MGAPATECPTSRLHRRRLLLALVLAALPVAAGCGASPEPGHVDAGIATSSPDAGAVADASSVPADAAFALDAETPDAGPAADTGLLPTAAETAAFQAFLGDVNAELSAGGTPGASVAVVLHGQLMFAAGVGKKRWDAPDPVTTATLFRAASLSKMIVAATAMSLVDEGKLDLHAPITNYLPWFALAAPFDAGTVTLEHLLTHTSGFPCDTLSLCPSLGSRQSFFAANPQPLWAPPGAVYDYSNQGFALASMVATGAAGVADTQFEQLAHDRVFARAGMTTATYDAAAAQAGDHATGHLLDATNAVTSTEDFTAIDCPLIHPFGGVLATASDYGHFIEAMLAYDGRMLSAASITAMETPHVSLHTFDSQSYGYGLDIQNYPYGVHSLVWHSGSLPGYLSIVFMVPDYEFGVAVMVNARGTRAVANNIGVAAMKRFIAVTQKWPTTKTAPSTWGVYAGTFADPFGLLGTLTVSVVGSGSTAQVMVDAPNASPSPISGAMAQSAGDEWTMPDVYGTAATFFPDQSGTPAVYFVTRNGIAKRQ